MVECSLYPKELPLGGSNSNLWGCFYITKQFQDWGKPGDIHNLGIDWHIPTNEEISAAQKLVDEFLSDELETVSKFARGEIVLDRDQILNRLTVMSNIIYGCGSLLPFWHVENVSEKEDVELFSPKRLVDSVTNLTPLKYVTSPRPLKLTVRGKNVRIEIAKVLFDLQVHFRTYNFTTFVWLASLKALTVGSTPG